MSTTILDKALFLHIPKTGGNFISKIMKEMGGDSIPHSSGYATFKELPYKIEDVRSFCFVRHPANYIHSTWAYFRSHPEIREFNKTAPFNRTVYRYNKHLLNMIDSWSLENTVKNLTTNYRGFIGDFFYQYTRDCCYIGRTEALVDDFLNIMYMIKEYSISDMEQKYINQLKPTNTTFKEQDMTQDMIDDIIDSESELIKEWYEDIS